MSPPLWVIRRDDASVFLFGQGPWGVLVHDRWWPPLTAESFDTSDEYWHEVPDDPTLHDGDLLSRFGLSATALSDVLGEPERTDLQEAALTVGIDVASLDGCRPWLARESKQT